jgi:hypothetical protein
MGIILLISSGTTMLIDAKSKETPIPTSESRIRSKSMGIIIPDVIRVPSTPAEIPPNRDASKTLSDLLLARILSDAFIMNPSRIVLLPVLLNSFSY